MSQIQSGPVEPTSPFAEILERARALAPIVRERATEIEANRRLPGDVVEMLRSTGVFQNGIQ